MVRTIYLLLLCTSVTDLMTEAVILIELRHPRTCFTVVKYIYPAAKLRNHGALKSMISRSDLVSLGFGFKV